MGQYPTLKFLERHGGWLAVVLAVLLPLAALAALALGASPWWVVAGVAAGFVAFIAMRSYIELIRLMTDMLLPK